MDKRNKDLDELFKEKLTSENEAYSFSLYDWDALEQKLNLSKKRRNHNVFLYRTFVGTAAAALLIFFTIWMFKSNQSISLKPQRTLSIEQKQPESRGTTQERSEEIKNSVEEIHPIENFTSIAKDVNKISLENNGILDARNKVDENLRVYTINKVTGQKRRSTLLLHHQLPINPYRGLDNQINSTEVQYKQGIEPEAISRKNIVLSIFVAPALNSVSGFKNGEIGSDLGVLFSVDITKKLTFSTGAIYAKKLYEADFNSTIYPNIGRHQYESGGSNGTGESNNITVFPESVYADCRVLDIPLNINYSLVNKGKNKISVGTGISSYIMLNEKYHFEYADQNYVNSEKVELVNENKHIMSVLNLQASFTRQLSPTIGISLQPYFKIPVTDIGYAKAKLQTAGMGVNINFSLGGKK